MPYRSYCKKSLTLVMVGIVVLLQGCGEKIDARQAQSINGLVYKINDSDPFTGTVTNFSVPTGWVTGCSGEMPFKKGLQDGTFTCYANNKKIMEIELKEGKRNGITQIWDDKTGNIVAKIDWKNGEKNGLEEHTNPTTKKVISQINWENNIKNGSEKVWDADGNTLLTDLNWKDGKQSGFDNRGEFHINFKDGLWDGVRQHFAIGSYSQKYYLSSEEHFAAGRCDGLSREWDEYGNIQEESTCKNGIVQSITKQKWDKNKRLLIKVSGINIDNNADRKLVKDGKEQHWSEDDGHLIFLVDWEKGRPRKGFAEAWDGHKLMGSYTGVPNAEGDSLVKDGIEKVWDNNGRLRYEIKWEKGVAASMISYSQYDGKDVQDVTTNPKTDGMGLIADGIGTFFPTARDWNWGNW